MKYDVKCNPHWPSGELKELKEPFKQKELKEQREQKELKEQREQREQKEQKPEARSQSPNNKPLGN